MSSDTALAELFEKAAKLTEYKKQLANLLLGEILRLSSDEEFDCPISAEHIAQLTDLWGDSEINSSTAKKLVGRLWEDGSRSPAEIVDTEGLRQIKSEEILLPLVEEAIAKNSRSVEDFINGKVNALKALIGYVMSKTGGLAEAKTVERLILDKII